MVAGKEKFARTVVVNGTNPSAVDVEALLATLPDCEGFDKLLEQESQCKHFIEADGPPVVACVKGYGVTQMTDPAPAFEQAWNWEADVKGGAAPDQQEQDSAETYLLRQGRTYASDQLRFETWSRWNGGPHHIWDPLTWLQHPRYGPSTKTITLLTGKFSLSP